MPFFQHGLSQLALVALCALALLHQVSALTVEYCSDINTASTPKNSSIFQSNGLCYDFCIAQYAFAVLQDDGCWCSNYAPSTTTTGCDDSCPGYPDDKCGGSGLYGYIALNLSPSGTEGGGAAASTTATTPAQSIALTTSISAATTPLTTSHPTTAGGTSSTWTPTPVISLETVTGEVRTVTVTPTVPPNSSSAAEIKKTSSGGGLSTSAAVGLTIGLVALVAIISSIIYFCIKKRNEQKSQELNDTSRRNSTVGLGGPVPSRTMSENSRYVLGTDGRQVVEGWEEAGDTPGSRRSKLVPVDPRLDPFAPVYQRNDNKSRESINTIRDELDYSRRINTGPTILRATNPDPDSMVE